MLRVIEKLLGRLDGRRYKRRMERALALHLRGEVRRDGLSPTRSTTHLEIEWRARDIHPWDSSLLSPSQVAGAFVEQSLADTEAAIDGLFQELPQVDVLTVRVFDHASDSLIISGTVARPAAATRDNSLSIGMRLRYRGLTFHTPGNRFEALDEPCTSARVA